MLVRGAGQVGVTAMSIEFLFRVMEMFKIDCGYGCTTLYIAYTMELYNLNR